MPISSRYSRPLMTTPKMPSTIAAITSSRTGQSWVLDSARTIIGEPAAARRQTSVRTSGRSGRRSFFVAGRQLASVHVNLL
jgi:hypothetical protein